MSDEAPSCSLCNKPLPTGWVGERGVVRYETSGGPVVVCSAECDAQFCATPRPPMPEPAPAEVPT